MNLKHQDIEIVAGQPFANCKLDRQKYTDVLTNIIDSYPRGFVLAINNKWGTGKTTFVKMWEQHLKDHKYQTVNFNAWENDFENNPLTALMGELKTLIKQSTEPAFQSALGKAAVLTKNIAPIFVQAVVNRYIDTEGVRDAITGITNGLTDIFEKDVNEYAEKKKSISDFRSSLSEFIARTNEGKPLVFIIDELDRCRPNYAVSILEQIKHFFTVPNIVFVLSIDKVQLGNAIRGVYGSESLDADEYLRRFIDLEYSIPEPAGGIFYKYLYEYFKYDEFFRSMDRIKYPDLQHDVESFFQVCHLLFSNTSVSLRQQEKIFALARISLRSFNANNYVIPNLFLLLTFPKIVYNEFYLGLKNKNLSFLQVQKYFIKIFNNFDQEHDKMKLMRLEAHLIYFYYNYLNLSYLVEDLFEHDIKTGTRKLKIESIINDNEEENFHIIFNSIENSPGSGIDLGYLINRIDLLENIKV